MSNTQKRREELLAKLIRYANYELPEYEHLENKLRVRWSNENSPSPTLQIDTTLDSLLRLLNRPINRQEKDSLAYDISCLGKLGILDDQRSERKGSSEWRFKLELWSKNDVDKNIKQLRILIEARDRKSKSSSNSEQSSENRSTDDNEQKSASKSADSTTDRNSTSPQPNIDINAGDHSNCFGIVNISDGGSFTINNDSPDRRYRNQQLLIAEIFTTIESLDLRLSYVDQAIVPTPVELKLSSLRLKIIPSIAVENDLAWQRLMAQQTVASLRPNLNSQPLNLHINSVLIADLPAKLDRELIVNFQAAIGEVEYCTDALLNLLQNIAQNPYLQESDRELNDRRLAIEMQRLENRSQIAYLQALKILLCLVESPTSLESRLATLNYLKTPKNIAIPQINELMSQLVDVAEKLVSARAELLQNSTIQLQQKLAEYEQIEELLKINPTDLWNEVIGKAISLRKFGRIGEAIAAFARYGEMFGSQDSTAIEYAQIAQQFSLQIQDLGVQGGVYIYGVNPKNEESDRVLQVGDIIIGFGDRRIQNMLDITEAIRDTAMGSMVKITYLRRDRSGKFISSVCNTMGKPLGLSLMPI